MSNASYGFWWFMGFLYWIVVPTLFFKGNSPVVMLVYHPAPLIVIFGYLMLSSRLALMRRSKPHE